MLSYAIAFVLTILIETCVAFLLGYHRGKILLGVVLVNLFTHPLLTALLYANATYGEFIERRTLTLVLEGGVVLVEGYLLADTFDLPRRDLYRLSLAMNLASYLTGVLLFGF